MLLELFELGELFEEAKYIIDFLLHSILCYSLINRILHKSVYFILINFLK